MRTRRRWSIPIGSIAGIPIRIHLSFLLLVALVLADAKTESGGTVGWAFVSLVVVFGCVLIHELCHCVAARRYGISVRDILLLPIGGVSEMESMPEEPHRELVIAAAGPAASVALAVGALVLAVLTGGRIWPPSLMTGSVLARIGWMNALLAAFNLLPILPLDGGRVFRAAFALKVGRSRATRIASVLGRVGGGAVILVGVYYFDLLLVFVGGFVFLGATAEGQLQLAEDALVGVPVQAAMVWPPWTADENDWITPGPLHQACERQGGLPVCSAGEYLGMISERQVTHGDGGGGIAGDLVDRLAPTVDASDHLDAVVEALSHSHHPAVAVLGPDRKVIGLVRGIDLQPKLAQMAGMPPSR